MFSDFPDVTVEIDVNASPEKVWSFVSDINVPAQFSLEFQGAEWVDGVAQGLGARFEGRNAIGATAWTTVCTIVEYEPDACFAWAVGEPDNPVAVWGFRIAPSVDGSALTMHALLGPALTPPRAAATAAPENADEIIGSRLATWRKNMVATIEGIKALAED